MKEGPNYFSLYCGPRHGYVSHAAVPLPLAYWLAQCTASFMLDSRAYRKAQRRIPGWCTGVLWHVLSSLIFRLRGSTRGRWRGVAMCDTWPREADHEGSDVVLLDLYLRFVIV